MTIEYPYVITVRYKKQNCWHHQVAKTWESAKKKAKMAREHGHTATIEKKESQWIAEFECIQCKLNMPGIRTSSKKAIKRFISMAGDKGTCPRCGNPMKVVTRIWIHP